MTTSPDDLGTTIRRGALMGLALSAPGALVAVVGAVREADFLGLLRGVLLAFCLAAAGAAGALVFAITADWRRREGGPVIGAWCLTVPVAAQPDPPSRNRRPAGFAGSRAERPPPALAPTCRRRDLPGRRTLITGV